MSELAHQLIEKEKQEKTGQLDLGRCGLTELPDALFELVWLEELNLEDNKIVEISRACLPASPLQHLTALQSLKLTCYGTVDLEPLQHLTALQSLKLECYGLVDLEPLQHLTTLQELDLSRNQIVDI